MQTSRNPSQSAEAGRPAGSVNGHPPTADDADRSTGAGAEIGGRDAGADRPSLRRSVVAAADRGVDSTEQAEYGISAGTLRTMSKGGVITSSHL